MAPPNLLNAVRIIAATGLLLLGTRPCRATDVSGDVSGLWGIGQSPVHVTGDVRVPQGSSLDIRPGVTVLLDPGVSLTVEGSLTATGNQFSQVLITAADPAQPWRSLVVSGGGSASLTNCAVRNGGLGSVLETTGMIRLQTGYLTLLDTEVSGSASSGVYLDGGGLNAAGCRFFGNGGSQPTDAAIFVAYGGVTLASGPLSNAIVNGVWGIYNEDIAPVDASGTWWGSASGPQHADNVLGRGSSVSDDVIFANFVTVNPFDTPGDVNRDGSVDMTDVSLVLRAAGGLSTASRDTMRGDVTADGTVDLMDAARLVRSVLGGPGFSN